LPGTGAARILGGMNAKQALAFVSEHGVALVSGKGPAPRLVEAIAGESIKGSWWAHPSAHEIFRVLSQLGDSPDILVCRLVDGKVCFVHRRLWAALVRLADRFDVDRLAQVRQEHTAKGHHVNLRVPFPLWVPAAVREQANQLTEREALEQLGHLVPPLR
jgi:hypothetical protein